MSEQNISSTTANDRALRATAAEWLARRGAGFTAAEAAEFVRWRDGDPRHAAAFEHVQATQNRLLRLPESPAAAAMLKELDAIVGTRRAAQRRLWWRASGALAAAACLAMTLWLAWPSADPNHVVYSSTMGQHQSVSLTDGSTLVLKGESEVEIDFAASERRVQLRRGETHFFVAKDPARPFLVGAGAVTIRAVGTAFNVRRDSALVEVLVTEGKVEVSPTETVPGRTAAEPIPLVSGQRVQIDTLREDSFAAAAAQLAAGAGAEDAPSRRAPRLYFSDTPLSEVVARFNRYSEIQMEIAEPELGRRAVGGNFDADNAESFIALLNTSGDVRVERLSPTRVRLHKAR